MAKHNAAVYTDAARKSRSAPMESTLGGATGTLRVTGLERVDRKTVRPLWVFMYISA